LTVSSFYSVFVTSDMAKMMARFARTGSMRMVHHFESADFDYYVMSDNSDNKTDFIQFKNMDVKGAFYAVRINTDDYNQMAAILRENGFSVTDTRVETERMKLGLFVSENKEPNILLFEHKK